MGQIAFVFAGQGAQYSGMGKDLADCSPAAGAVFQKADEIRPGTSRQCFSGTEEELRITSNTQPCIFTVALAAAAALGEAGVRAQMTAGFSLGELAALTYAGCVPFQEGLALVDLRGRLMQDCAQETETAMAAVLKLDEKTVETLCEKHEGMYPVNYNCPGQISVAGLASEMDAFKQAVKEAGGRAIPLKVAGGFHSPFMKGAAEAFGAALEKTAFTSPEVTLYSNFTGLPYDREPKALLKEQIQSPVRWEGIVRHMIAAGVDTFIELGPGKTLRGFISKIDPAVRAFHVEDGESLKETIREVRSC